MCASVVQRRRRLACLVVAVSSVGAGAVFALSASRSDASGIKETPSTTTSVVVIEPAPVTTTTSVPVIEPARVTTTTSVLVIDQTPPSTSSVIEPTPSTTVVAPLVGAPVVTPRKASPCRDDLPGAVMTLSMPDISYRCSVYAGGQAVIDAGVATLITDVGSSPLLATHAGDAGTLWIAAHRSTHGGPFAAVPSLADGAVVTVSDSGRTASYRVVGRAHVQVRDGLVVDSSGTATDAATQDAVLRPDRGGSVAPRLVLQTCDGKDSRWMIYADLITG